MRLQEWSDRRSARDPEYSRALAEVDFGQTLADILVDARIRADLTQAELAALAGTTQARISQIEHGDGNPKIGTVARIVRALRQLVDVDLTRLTEYDPAEPLGFAWVDDLHRSSVHSTAIPTATGEYPTTTWHVEKRHSLRVVAVAAAA